MTFLDGGGKNRSGKPTVLLTLMRSAILDLPRGWLRPGSLCKEIGGITGRDADSGQLEVGT